MSVSTRATAGYGSILKNIDREANVSLEEANFTTSGLEEDEENLSSSRFGLYFQFAFVLFFVIAGSVATVQLYGRSSQNESKDLKINNNLASNINLDAVQSSSFGIKLRASNEYGEINMEYPWLRESAKILLFEPYKVMQVTAYGFEDYLVSNNDIFSWTFNTKEGETYYSQRTKDYTLLVNLKSDQDMSLNFQILDGESEKVKFEDTYTVYSKYVKRELRSLTVEDREKFLATASMLWKMDTATGREKYGQYYTSIETFVLEHAIASNNIMCDQFHEGSGFLTHHMALQSSFESALKAIEPSVVLPYWDFTIEGQEIQNAGESPDYFLKISPFFTDTWFGESDEYGHIKNSRWASTTFPTTDGDGRVQPNSYGLIRSYWNNNNDPQITRSPFSVLGQVVKNKEIPTCSSHYDILNTANLGAFQLLSPAYGHGPMHVQSGGVTGGIVQQLADFKEKWKDVLFKEYTDEELSSIGLSSSLRAYDEVYPLNGLFDYKDNTPHLLVCPDSCSSDTPVSECSCSIPSLESGETDWDNVYHCIIFSSSIREEFALAFPEEMLKDLTFLTARAEVIEGEMLEAASPADILFWVIHPAINRLEHAKRLETITEMAGVPFHKWLPEEEEWLHYSYYDFDAGTKSSFPDGYNCTGHGADDSVLPDALPLQQGFAQRADTNQDGIVSNIEFYQGTDPNDPSKLEYVFDNFNWNHCVGHIDSSISSS